MSHVGLNASAPQQHAARTQGTRQLLYKQQPATQNRIRSKPLAHCNYNNTKHYAAAAAHCIMQNTKLTETETKRIRLRQTSVSEYQNQNEPPAWQEARSQEGSRRATCHRP